MLSRSNTILEALVWEFIENGEPVSSGHLYENYNFGIKPAMIRLVLNDLEEEGYLAQSHHSAGRVPTDRGLEFYAEKFLVHSSFSKGGGSLREPEDFEKENKSLPASQVLPLKKGELAEFLRELSDELKVLSVAADFARETVYKMGLEALVDRLDFENKEVVCSVIHDFEAIDERLPKAAQKLGDGPKVFIGKKSPVTQSENLSVVGGNYRIGDTYVSIFAIGPKRMDYKKAIKIFRNL